MSKSYRLASLSLAIVFAFSWNFGASASAGDPLPSWNDVESKQAIISFVEKVTKPGPNYVPPAERIATFDNDGTILSESPSYVQLAFVIKRVKELAPQHPQWKDKQQFIARRKLVGQCQTSQDWAALHRDGLPAHARIVSLSTGKRISHVHCVRRRPRVHAPMDGKNLRHSARTSHWQQHQDNL